MEALKICFGDVIEFITYQRPGRGRTAKVLKTGEVVLKVPAGVGNVRAMLQTGMGKKEMTLDFKDGVAYDHETYVVAVAAVRKGAMRFARPRVHNITRVIAKAVKQQSLFDSAPSQVPHRKGLDQFLDVVNLSNTPRPQPTPYNNELFRKLGDELAKTAPKSVPNPFHDISKFISTLAGHTLTIIHYAGGCTAMIDGVVIPRVCSWGGAGEEGGSYQTLKFQ